MDLNLKKELFSRAYVQALAAQAGFRTAIPDVDDDSIDVIIRGKDYTSPIRNPQIDVQLKCTATDAGTSELFHFPLPAKNYNELRGSNVACPRYLFVMIIPPNCDTWIRHTPSFVILRHYAYWISLRSVRGTANHSSVTLHIPRSQRLTLPTMQQIMGAASFGKSL